MNKLKVLFKDVMMIAILVTFMLSLTLTFISYTPVRYAIICALSFIVLVKELKNE